MVRRGQHRVFSPVGCRLRVAIIPARAAFAAPGPLGARHATYKVRIEVWCIWRGEPAGKSDLRGRVVSEDVFSPALELRLFCGAGSREGVAPYPEEAETHGTVWAPSWLALSGEVQTSESLFCAF